MAVSRFVTCGMNTNHANDQKKAAKLLYEWKVESWLQSLAHGKMLEFSQNEVDLFTQSVQSAVVDQCGGFLAWNALPKDDRDSCYSGIHSAHVHDLGQSIYDNLPEGDCWQINTFVWLGCMMHKDLNCVKGGCETFQTTWSTLSVHGPALLPNKSNVSTLQLLTSEPDLSPAGDTAAGALGGRVVKLASLLGLCFNHKDDETGQQDSYHDYFQAYHGEAQ